MRRAPGDGDFDLLINLAQIESAGTGGIRIAVASCRLPPLCGVNRGENFATSPPVGNTRALEVRDDYGRVTGSAYVECFTQRVEDFIGFGAQVRCVNGTCGSQWL